MMILMAIWSKVKSSRLLQAIILGLLLFSGGYLLGRAHKVPAKVETHAVADVVTKQKLADALKIQQDLQEQLTQAKKTITELSSHKVVHTHTEKKPDGTLVTDTTTTTDTEKNTNSTTDTSQKVVDNTSTVDNKTSTTDTTSHTDTKTISTPMVKDHWYAGVSAALSLKGVSDPGVELKYRLIGPFWLGASVDTSFSVRGTLGVSF